MTQFMAKETPADRQRLRDELLDTTAKDFTDFASRMKKLDQSASVCVFGPQAALELANTVLPENSRLHIEQAFTD